MEITLQLRDMEAEDEKKKQRKGQEEGKSDAKEKEKQKQKQKQKRKRKWIGDGMMNEKHTHVQHGLISASKSSSSSTSNSSSSSSASSGGKVERLDVDEQMIEQLWAVKGIQVLTIVRASGMVKRCREL